MDITGHATDYVMDTAFPATMSHFVHRARQRWPDLHIDGSPAAPVTPAPLTSWTLPPRAPDDALPGLVSFSSGQEMEDFWEEHGYALDPTGQGPYSVFYRLRQRPLHAGRLTGIRGAAPEDAAATEGTSLLLASYYTVSLVTPEDPATDPFSASVLTDFLDSFAAAGRTAVTRVPEPHAPPPAATRTPSRTRTASPARTTTPPASP